MNLSKAFTKLANRVSKAAGRPLTFGACVALVLLWAASGPIFKFSETWQLVINTGTTIVTFLMVFLIQNTQNRDNAALQAKLDELIRVGKAENAFIGIEKLTDQELEAILVECERNAPKLRKIVKEDTPHRPGGDGKAALEALRGVQQQEDNGVNSKSQGARKGAATKRSAKPRSPAKRRA